MKRIKPYLKNVGITQKELAELLNLSRPTLDTYIELYERGDSIPKERYQKIFDALFLAKHETRESFIETLSKSSELLMRDQFLGVMELKTEDADLVSKVIQRIRDDAAKEGWDRSIYIFINMLLSNYRSNKIFFHLAEYFAVLNGIIGIDTIEEVQIPYFSNFYKTFHKLSIDEVTYVEDDYRAFLKRCEELLDEKEKNKRKYQNDILEHLQKKIEKYEEMGIEISSDDLKKMVDSL